MKLLHIGAVYEDSRSDIAFVCFFSLRGRRIFAYLSFSVDKVFRTRQSIEPHRTTHMELLRADANLGAKAKLKAVGKACRSIHIDGRGIDTLLESIRRTNIVGNDCFGMSRIVLIDMCDCRLHICDNAN